MDALQGAVEENALPKEPGRQVTMVTGEGAYSFLETLLDELRDRCDNIKIKLIPVKNDFFGGTVNVAGLLTGQDIFAPPQTGSQAGR